MCFSFSPNKLSGEVAAKLMNTHIKIKLNIILDKYNHKIIKEWQKIHLELMV